MADNYLERKMEELRNGKPGAVPTRQYTIKRNQLSYPYKTLRILIVGNGRKFISEYAREFRNHEGRVAIFNTCPESVTDLGENHGCRYQVITESDLENAFTNLVKAWRDIDVVVMLDTLPVMQSLLARHIKSVPYPNEWGMPVLEVCDGMINRHSSPDYVPSMNPTPDIPGSNAAKQLPYLSLPQNGGISRIILQPCNNDNLVTLYK